MKRPCLLTVENTAPMNDNKQIDPRRASPRMGILAAYVMPWSPSPLSSKRTRGTTTDGIPERVGGRNPFHIQDLAEHHETRVAVSRECLKTAGVIGSRFKVGFPWSRWRKTESFGIQDQDETHAKKHVA